MIFYITLEQTVTMTDAVTRAAKSVVSEVSCKLTKFA